MKPRIYRDTRTKTMWECISKETCGRGSSPERAFSEWRAIMEEIDFMKRVAQKREAAASVFKI